MSKPKSISLTCKAVAVVVAEGQNIPITEAVELTIENGSIVGIKVLTRAPDIIAQSIGKASQALWEHYRDSHTNRIDVGQWRKKE